jgi:hypothetical protein
MTMNALAMPATTTPTLRLVTGGALSKGAAWWEKRAFLRSIVGGCPDHWWNPVARRTAACTCDRF